LGKTTIAHGANQAADSKSEWRIDRINQLSSKSFREPNLNDEFTTIYSDISDNAWFNGNGICLGSNAVQTPARS
jgi:hypothetical protein